MNGNAGNKKRSLTDLLKNLTKKQVCTNSRFPCNFCLKASPPYIPRPQFHDAYHSRKIIENRESKFFQMYFCFFVLYLQSLWSQNKQPVLAPCLREWWCGGRLEKEAANLFTKSFPSFLFLQHWYFHHLSVKSDKRLDSGKETLYHFLCFLI